MNKELVKFVLLPLYDGYAEYDSMAMGVEYPQMFYEVVTFPMTWSNSKIRDFLNMVNNDMYETSYDIVIHDINSVEIHITMDSLNYTSVEYVINDICDHDEEAYYYLREMLNN